MHPHHAVIDTFYNALAIRDAATMTACYHQGIEFRDPAFGTLKGPRARAMWHMLCQRGEDLQVIHSDLGANDQTGHAHWDATYTFSVTDRVVHNAIDAAFTFKDGLIATHHDTFDMRRWCAQAFGLPGRVLGGFGVVQRALQSRINKELDAFIAHKGPF